MLVGFKSALCLAKCSMEKKEIRFDQIRDLTRSLVKSDYIMISEDEYMVIQF